MKTGDLALLAALLYLATKIKEKPEPRVDRLAPSPGGR